MHFENQYGLSLLWDKARVTQSVWYFIEETNSLLNDVRIICIILKQSNVYKKMFFLS